MVCPLFQQAPIKCKHHAHTFEYHFHHRRRIGHRPRSGGGISSARQSGDHRRTARAGAEKRLRRESGNELRSRSTRRCRKHTDCRAARNLTVSRLELRGQQRGSAKSARFRLAQVPATPTWSRRSRPICWGRSGCVRQFIPHLTNPAGCDVDQYFFRTCVRASGAGSGVLRDQGRGPFLHRFAAASTEAGRQLKWSNWSRRTSTRTWTTAGADPRGRRRCRCLSSSTRRWRDSPEIPMRLQLEARSFCTRVPARARLLRRLSHE